MLAKISSEDISTCPTATPKHNTFLSWNLIVDLTSKTLAPKSSAWEIGLYHKKDANKFKGQTN